MKKVFKILSFILLALILVIIITPFALKGKIKGLVLNEANKSLNARLEVGKVNISLLRSFPNVYVGLNEIIITGQGAFESDTLVKIGSLSISTSIMDLIGGSPYEIKRINIDEADLRMKVLPDGQANWNIAKPSESGVEKAGTKESDKFRLLLKSLVINDSRLVYDDAPTNTYVELDGLFHSLRGDLGEDFTSLETQTGILKAFVSYDGIVYLRNAAVDLKASLDADLVKNIFTIKENMLTINDFQLIVDGSVGLPDDGYDLDLSFSTPDNSFKKLLSLIPAIYARDFESVKTDGTIGFNGFVKGKYSDDHYPAFGLNLLVKDAWFQYPDLPGTVNDINMDARVESSGGDLDNTVVDVSKLAINLAGNPVSARLLLKNPITDPYIDTRIEASLNLSEIEKFYPLEDGEDLSGQIAADITLKGRISDLEQGRYSAFEASGNFNSNGIEYNTAYLARKLKIEKAALTITPAYLDLTDLKLKAGNSDFSLKGKLENYLAYYLKGEVLKGNFDLRSALIDVNELLAFPETDGSEVNDTSSLSAFIVPAGIDFTLGVSAAAVKYMNYDIRNLTGQIKIKDQKLLLDGISMNAMEGRLQLNGSYATTDPANPVIDFDLGLKEISIRETFKQIAIVEKFAPIAEKMLGDFSGNIKLAGLLDGSMMPRLETIAGGGDLITSAIEVSSVNTLNQLSNSLKMDQLKNIKMNGAKIILEFLDGVMKVKPFDFKALGIDMNLSGQTALSQQIGYTLKMKIPRSMMGGAANNVLNDLAAKAGQAGTDVQLGDYINVDALINGTITEPKVSINLAGTGKDIVESVKEQVQQQVEQKVEEVKEDAKKEAEKIIQEADRQAQAILDQAQKQSQEVLKSAQGLAEEAKKQANANADKIIQEAKGKGYVAELAAKKSAEEVRKQGDKQSQNILAEAQKQSGSILEKARQEAEKIKSEARAKVN